MSVLRLLIVAEDPLARAGLAAALASEPEVEVVGRLGPSDEIITRVAAFDPDVVLFDLGWEGGRGEAAPDAAPDEAARTRVRVETRRGDRRGVDHQVGDAARGGDVRRLLRAGRQLF